MGGVFLWFLWMFTCLAGPSCLPEGPSAVFSTPTGQKQISLELARTDQERNRGLMFRNNLDEDHGMLFLFDKDTRPAFWMKNTYLSLDLLFLSREQVIVDIFERLSPCPMDPCPQFRPRFPVRYALEVRGGFVARNGIRVGDRVRLEGVSPGTAR